MAQAMTGLEGVQNLYLDRSEAADTMCNSLSSANQELKVNRAQLSCVFGPV